MSEVFDDDLATQRAMMFDSAGSAAERQETQVAVFAYEAPVRIWHWVNFLCMLVLCVTGWLIGQPPPSIGGEASTNFLFGWIRFSHFAAGQVFAYAFVGRMIFAFVGNPTARELFVVPVWSRQWWHDLFSTFKWYFFLQKRPQRFIGHNPLAQAMMFTTFVLPAFVIIATGVALYVEPYGIDHPVYMLTDLVFMMTGGSLQTHAWHHLSMWLIICFSILHIYAAVREEIMSRQSMISTMVSGWRMFKD
ncbi:MAG: Ni/Fe-hydrogenase, b-type cytochrome subunit [Siculibacillus sp.]|nr:Ni/Fe-hydrogenase, b-type cytochrome subunit [Siculibacillus sp.]